MTAPAIPLTSDDSDFQAWKRQRAPQITTPDEVEFQAWKAAKRTQGTPESHGILSGIAQRAYPLVKGGTANFADEVAGAIGALSQGSSYQSPAQFVKNYQTSRQDYLAHEQGFIKQHPVESATEEIAGGLLPMIGGGGISEAVLPRVGAAVPTGIRGAATEGALWGALSGAGGGDGTANRLGHAVAGGIGGGILSGGLSAAGKIGGAAGGALKSVLTPTAQKASQAADIVLAHQADADGGLQALLQRAVSDRAVGAEPLVATSGGKGVNDLAWLSANIPSQNRQGLIDALERAKSFERPMLESSLEEAAGTSPTSAYRSGQTIANQQAISANRLYGIAEKAAPITDPEITRTIIQEPELLNAMQRTLKGLGQAATPEEQKAVQAMQFLAANPNVPVQALAQPIPIRLLNEMKKGSDDLIQSLLAKDQSFTQLDANRIRGAMGAILDRADAQSPEYAAARRVFQADASRLEAMGAGQGLISKRPELIADEVAGRIPLETGMSFPRPLSAQNTPDYLRGGIDALKQQMAEKAKTRLPNLTSQVFGEGEPIDRVRALLGGDGSATLEPAIDAARRLESTYGRAFGGSSTSGNEAVKMTADEFTPADLMKFFESPRWAAYNFLSKMSRGQRASFQSALSSELAQRLATDPTGQAGHELVGRLQGLLDQNSLAAVIVRAQKSAKNMRLLGAITGRLAGGAISGSP